VGRKKRKAIQKTTPSVLKGREREISMSMLLSMNARSSMRPRLIF